MLALKRAMARGLTVLIIFLLVLILPFTFFLLPFLPVALVLYLMIRSPRYIVVWLLILVLLSPLALASVLHMIEMFTDLGAEGAGFNPRV